MWRGHATVHSRTTRRGVTVLTSGRHGHEDDFRQADTNSPPDSPRDHGWGKWRTNKLASRLVIALTATFLIGLLIKGPDFGGPPSATKHRLKGTVRLFEKSSQERADPPRADDEDDVRIASEPKEAEQAVHPTETDEDTVQVDKDDKESSQEHVRSFKSAPEADEDLVQVADDVPERMQEQSTSSSNTEPDEDIIRVAKDAPESHQELSARSNNAQPDEDTVQVPNDAGSSQEQEPSAGGNANAELEKDSVQVPTDLPESSQEISTSPTDKATAGEVASESPKGSTEGLKDESEVPVKPEAPNEESQLPPSKPSDVPAVEGFTAVQELPTRRPVSATLAPIPTEPVREPEAGRLREEPAAETAASGASSQRAGHVAAESVLKRMEKARDEPSLEDAAEAVVSKTESEQTSVRIPVAVAVSESPSKETGEVRAETAEGSRVPKPEDASVEAPLPPKVAAASPEALPPTVSETTTPSALAVASPESPSASETGQVHLESATTRAPAEIHQPEAEPVSIGQAVETRAEIKAESPEAGSPVAVQTQAIPGPVIDSSTVPPVLVEGSATIATRISNGASSIESAKPETGEVTVAENFPEASADVRVESEDVQLTDDAAQSATLAPDGTILQQAEGAITRAEAGLKEAEKELAKTGGQVLEQVQKAAAAGQEVLHEVEEETSAVVQAVEKAVGTGVTGQMLSQEDEVTIASPQ
ncbi:unnamed protein product [Symbiodinium sp. KB8]|nr:unnamed protein product [Symbiodinium sp. KB8]